MGFSLKGSSGLSFDAAYLSNIDNKDNKFEEDYEDDKDHGDKNNKDKIKDN